MSPPNRFTHLHVVAEPDLDEEDQAARNPRTQFLTDRSRGIVSENDSPDVPFRYSLNPYRGCEHGCSYCYGRR